MTDSRHGHPAAEQSVHALPRHTASLAPTTQHAVPGPGHLPTKGLQRVTVAWHTVITDVAIHDRSHPLPLFLQGCMHAPPQFDSNRLELRLHALSVCLPLDRKSTRLNSSHLGI